MWDLVVIGILYVLSVGLFRWLGGFGAAGDAFRVWGRSHSAMRAGHGSSSS
jgi:hypothetical protein